MKFRGYLIGLAAILMVLFLVVSISDVSAQDDTPPEPPRIRWRWSMSIFQLSPLRQEKVR